MKQLWLDLKMYGLRLVMVRSSQANSPHKLVATGPSIATHRTSLANLGFQQEEGFKREYWSRPLAGINNAKLLGVFPLGELKEMDISAIMPSRDAVLDRPNNRGASQTSPRNIPNESTSQQPVSQPGSLNNGSRGNGLAGTGANAILGADNPSVHDGTSPSDDHRSEQQGRTESVLDEAAGSSSGGSSQSGTDLENPEQNRIDRLDAGAGGAQQPGENIRPRTSTSGSSTESSSFDRRNQPAVNQAAESAKAVVAQVATQSAYALGEWVLSPAAGHWEYADLSHNGIQLRIGVSSGSVISVDGRPHDSAGKVLQTAEQLAGVLAEKFLSPDEWFAEEFRVSGGEWTPSRTSTESDHLKFTLPGMAKAYSVSIGVGPSDIDARVVDNRNGDVVYELSGAELSAHLEPKTDNNAPIEVTSMGMDEFDLSDNGLDLPPFVPSGPLMVAEGQSIVSSQVIVTNTAVSKKDVANYKLPERVNAWRVSVVEHADNTFSSVVEVMNGDHGVVNGKVVANFEIIDSYAHDALERIAPTINRAAISAYEQALVNSKQSNLFPVVDEEPPAPQIHTPESLSVYAVDQIVAKLNGLELNSELIDQAVDEEASNIGLMAVLIDHPGSQEPTFAEALSAFDFDAARVAVRSSVTVTTANQVTGANALASDIAVRVTEQLALDVPDDWIVMNAPRPLMGDKVTQDGEFLAGRFYAAIDPNSHDAASHIESNLKMAAVIVVQMDKDEQVDIALLDNKYAATYRAEYQGTDLYQVVNPHERLSKMTFGEIQAARAVIEAGLQDGNSQTQATQVVLTEAELKQKSREVRHLFETGEKIEAFELQVETFGNAQGVLFADFERTMHETAGSAISHSALSQGQRFNLSAGGLTSSVIDHVAESGLTSGHGGLDEWVENRQAEVSKELTANGWNAEGRVWQKANLFIERELLTSHWQYKIYRDEEGSTQPVIEIDDRFDEEAHVFVEQLSSAFEEALSVLEEADQAAIIEAAALQSQVEELEAIASEQASQEDPDFSPEVDRVWRGFTIADLQESHRHKIGSTAFNTETSIKALVEAEQNGINALSASSRNSLLSFYGWGGVANSIRTDNAKASKNRDGNDIANLLDLDSGAYNRHLLANRLESYYTPAQIIDPMWKAMEHLGLPADARMFDAGCGAGYFFVGAPEKYQRHARMVGIECDSVAARIAKVNAPDMVMVNTKFEQAVLEKNFNAVVGNVPFGETKISDSRYPGATHIHDYFIVRSLDHLADNGLMTLITSSGTLDKQDDAIRQQIMERANLVGAFRLPNGVFKAQGANVTTDVLVLQKRPAGTAPDYDFTQVSSVSLRDLSGELHDFNLNQYFVDHPENVLGEIDVESSAFGPKMVVSPLVSWTASRNQPLMVAEVSEQLLDRIKAMPAGLYARTEWPAATNQAKKSIVLKENSFDEIQDAFYLDEYTGYVGDYIINNDKLCEILDVVDQFDDDGVRTKQSYAVAPLVLNRKGHEELLRAYIPLRDASRDLMVAQQHGSDDELAAAQANTKELYDAFVAEFGHLNKRSNQNVFADDAGSAETLALEVWDDEQDELSKVADAFSKRVIRQAPNAQIESAQDAYYSSLDLRGQVDFNYMAAVSGISEEQLKDDLVGKDVFVDPVTGEFMPAFEYLSGNVVKRLEQAREALLTSDKWEINVRSLEDVQPLPIPFADITIRLGANWIPTEDIRQFTASLFGVHEISVGDFCVNYIEGVGQWVVSVSNAFKRDHDSRRRTLWGTNNISYEQLLEKLLNNQRPTHRHDVDGKNVIDDEATMLSRAKQDEINEKFHSWVAGDRVRTELYEKRYNECTNIFVLPEIDGSRLTFPGLNPTWVPRFHQSGFIARILHGYNAMAAHPVGAGKTFEMVAGAIKLKQVGKHTKPMIAVPNHMLGQITREAKQMYPGARILMITKEDLKGMNRRRFLAVARNNDWDLIVCTHSMLNGISAPFEVLEKELAKQVDVINGKMDETDNRRVERQLQAKLKTVSGRLESLREGFKDADLQQNILSIDKLGVDALFLDEAHLYKNLELNSAINVLGVTNGGSARAFNLSTLSQYLRGLHNKPTGLYEFTGTPIANSMCEMYVHNTYLRPDLLEDMGINHFDEWANRFGEVVTGLEALPEGSGYRVNERFSKFVNCPEMLKLFRTFADVKNKEELNLPTPKVTTQTIAVDQSEWQKAFMVSLSIRAQAVRGGKNGKKVDPREDNMLNIATAGRKAAMDMRLLESDLPDDSALKVAEVAKNVVAEYNATMEQKGTQLVFMDLGTPGAHKEFSTYENLKELLVAAGIPANEIAFMHDAKNDEQKEAIFAQVRSGQKRMLFGSTEKMGVGTNVQERLCAIHNVDCPWRPADIAQRLGRIERQGNLYFKDVKEYRYTTKDSFDIFMWETCSRKAKFISQSLGDPQSADREISEDMDLGYAEVMAVTTGNPKIREKVQVDDQVGKMERKQRAWLNDFVSKRSALWRYERELASVTNRAGHLKSAFEALPNSKYKAVEIRGAITGVQDGNTSWLYATAAGHALMKKMPFIQARMMKNNEQVASLNTFIGDIEIKLRPERDLKSFELVGYVGDNMLPINVQWASNNEKGLGAKLRSWYGVGKDLQNAHESAALYRNQIKAIGELGTQDEWEHEAELAALKAQKAELDRWFATQAESTVPTEDPYLRMIEEYRVTNGVEDKLELFEKDEFASLPDEDLFGAFDDEFNDSESYKEAQVGMRLG